MRVDDDAVSVCVCVCQVGVRENKLVHEGPIDVIITECKVGHWNEAG